jgi:hypothetical protein
MMPKNGYNYNLLKISLEGSTIITDRMHKELQSMTE